MQQVIFQSFTIAGKIVLILVFAYLMILLLVYAVYYFGADKIFRKDYCNSFKKLKNRKK